MIDISKNRNILLQRYKKSRSFRERERYHALSLIANGKSVKEVSDIFFVDEQTVRNWIEKWVKSRHLKDENRTGKPKQIDKNIEQKIIQLAEENDPKKHGMNCSFWDCNELRKFLLSEGISIGSETIRKILKRNGFKYVKAKYEYAQADKAKKTEFLQELRQILANREFRSTILFQDEMGTHLHPKKGYMWTRNKEAVVRTYSSHKRVSVIGAVNPITGTKEIMQTSENVDQKKFVEFLERIRKRFKNDVYFFLDNYRIHKSKYVNSWLESYPRIKLVFLPPYSPNLNLQEWLWGFVRKKFLNNRVFKSARQLMTSFSSFIRKLSKEEIKSVCNIDSLLNRIT